MPWSRTTLSLWDGVAGTLKHVHRMHLEETVLHTAIVLASETVVWYNQVGVVVYSVQIKLSFPRLERWGLVACMQVLSVSGAC